MFDDFDYSVTCEEYYNDETMYEGQFITEEDFY